MSAIVFAPFAGRQPATSTWTQKPNDSIAILNWNCANDDMAYQNGLRSLWRGPDDIVIVEHDIAATPDHVNELLSCRQPLCAFAYTLYPITTGLKEPVYAHRYWTLNGWIDEGWECAHYAGLGLTKISSRIRRNVHFAEDGTWRDLDYRVSAALTKYGLFHIHWPEVEHDHR